MYIFNILSFKMGEPLCFFLNLNEFRIKEGKRTINNKNVFNFFFSKKNIQQNLTIPIIRIIEKKKFAFE